MGTLGDSPALQPADCDSQASPASGLPGNWMLALAAGNSGKVLTGSGGL